MDEVITPDLAALIYEQIRGFIIRQAGADTIELPAIGAEASDISWERDNVANTKVASTVISETQDTDSARIPSDTNTPPKTVVNDCIPAELRDKTVQRELAKLDRAYASKVMYLVGKEQMKVKAGTSLPRTIFLASFLWIRDNTRAKIANLRLAMDRVVEVGFVKEI